MNSHANDLTDLLADYNFELPEHLIAQSPAPTREAARLLVVRRHPERGLPQLEDLLVKDLPQLIRETPSLQNSLWIRNRSRVIPARFYVRRPTGSRHEIVLLEEFSPGLWTAMIRGQSSFYYPQKLYSEKLESFRLESPEPGRIRFLPKNDLSVAHFLEAHGEMPLPPYIKNRIPERDRDRYQTVWSRPDKAASVAAPTASLHFTPELCAQMTDLGLSFADVILHVGLGTFEPVRTEKLSEHQLHEERVEVSNKSLELIRTQLQNKRPIVTVGTTALRTLESLCVLGEATRPGVSLQPGPEGLEGRTRLFVRPGLEFRYTDALFTNFHLPKSTLLVLVASFAGSRKLMGEAYDHAVKKSYRFFSFGDASLWI